MNYHQTIEMSYLPFVGGLAEGYIWVYSDLKRITIILHLGSGEWTDEMRYVKGADNKFYYQPATGSLKINEDENSL